MRLVDLLRFGEAALLGAGVTEYELDARLLLEHCTGKNRTEIFLSGESEVDLEVQNCYRNFLEQRQQRKPVAYILGEQEFWSMPFCVSPDVLIPRPETEYLLDMVFAITDPDNFQKGNILDLCCGSGVIATVLGKETGKLIFASDISRKALEMTKKNFKGFWETCSTKGVLLQSSKLMATTLDHARQSSFLPTFPRRFARIFLSLRIR